LLLSGFNYLSGALRLFAHSHISITELFSGLRSHCCPHCCPYPGPAAVPDPLLSPYIPPPHPVLLPRSASNYLLGLTPVELGPLVLGTVAGMSVWSILYASLGGASKALLESGADLDVLLAGEGTGGLLCCVCSE
jgi:hypothetical protein